MKWKIIFILANLFDFFQRVDDFFRSLSLREKVTIEGVVFSKIEEDVLETSPSTSDGDFVLSFPVSYVKVHKYFILIENRFSGDVSVIQVSKDYYNDLSVSDSISVPCMRFKWDSFYIAT